MYTAVKCLVFLCAAFAATEANLELNQILFHLFTRDHPTMSQPLHATVPSILLSNISLQRPTIFTIHNHGEGVASNFNAFLVPALLGNRDANVIAVDWSVGSAVYTIGLTNANSAADIVATFINILINDLEYNPELITIVGLGLGAHVAGIAGRKAAQPLVHIVALDPSLHGWTHHPDILSSDAATLVEVIHTTAGVWGYDRPLGHLDFYPNGGVQQTPCGINTACSHSYAYIFYAESLNAEVDNGAKFVGTACDDYQEAMTAQCSGERVVVFGGFEDKAGAAGVYTFLTNLISPFAQG